MESIYDPNYYYSIAVDLTNRCNGRCIFCPRNDFSAKMNEHTELDFDIFKKVFDHDYLNHIKNLILSGNLGDAGFYSKLFELLDYVKENNKEVNVFIATNGSMRSTSWWKELARKMSFNKGNIVRFAIDGLEDTHHLYRGTNYKIVLRNLIAYTNAGGVADWQFIIFKHNQHQLKKAKQIAKISKCSAFITLVSRSYNETNLQRPTILEAKTKTELCNITDTKEVFCTPIYDRHLYLSHEGFIYPCCDYGLFEDFRKIESYPVKAYIEYLRSLNDLDMSKSTLSDALNSRFFRYIIENREDLIRCKISCRIKKNNCNNKIQMREEINSIMSAEERIVPRSENITTNKIQMRLELGDQNV
jgi:MoaA/NifB/PqqE/SkfB family radical SAM enzyme